MSQWYMLLAGLIASMFTQEGKQMEGGDLRTCTLQREALSGAIVCPFNPARTLFMFHS